MHFYIFYTEKTILSKYLKIEVAKDLRIILLNHQNNYVRNLNMISKKYILTFYQPARAFYIIILVQHKTIFRCN